MHSGRPRKTSKKVDRIKHKSTANVNKTAAEIAPKLKDEILPNVSCIIETFCDH